MAFSLREISMFVGVPNDGDLNNDHDLLPPPIA